MVSVVTLIIILNKIKKKGPITGPRMIHEVGGTRDVFAEGG